MGQRKFGGLEGIRVLRGMRADETQLGYAIWKDNVLEHYGVSGAKRDIFS
jgi:hypothetical protein